MTAEAYRCQRCGTELQGNSMYCVACYRFLHQPCPNCMVLRVGGRYTTRCSGKPPRPVHCGVCHDERYIIVKEKGRANQRR